MSKHITDTEFDGTATLVQADYESCTFRHFDFSNVDLSAFRFMQCEFIQCNFSLTKTRKTMFDDVIFRECKLVGVRFDECNAFSLQLRFENCIISHGSFAQVRMQKSIFRNTKLLEVDFASTDLTGSLFDQCTLPLCVFDRSILENVDFSTSMEFSIDPENNRMGQAIFSTQHLSGLLDKYKLRIVD